MKPYDVIDVMTTTGKKKGPETHLQGIQSTSPSGAAGKAMTKICKIQKATGNCSLILTVKDVTTGKLFMYKVKRERVDNIVMRNGIPVLYKFNQVVRSMTPRL